MRYALSFLALALLPSAASAQGLATKTLSALGPAAAAALGPGFVARAEPDRLTLACTDCAGTPLVDLTLGRQADGTEDRVRSGATRIADLERLCQLRSPTCRISMLDIAPAVGWVSAYSLGDTAGATAVILRDGELLTVRSLGPDPAAARRGIDRLLPLIRTRIVGR